MAIHPAASSFVTLITILVVFYNKRQVRFVALHRTATGPRPAASLQTGCNTAQASIKTMPRAADDDERDLLRLPHNLFFRTAMLNFLMGRTLAPFYSAENLRSHEWKVLGVLWSYAPLPASDILQHVTFDKAAVSRALRILEESELILRQSRPGDRRITDVRLSKRGQQVYRRILDRVLTVQKELLAGLTGEQMEVLFTAFNVLDDQLRKRLNPTDG
jgi:DNA-binding MarR family transcriptional regulator